MALTAEKIKERLEGKFGGSVVNFRFEMDGILTFDVAASKNFEVMKFLKEDPELRFNFLTDVCGVHYPDFPEGEKFRSEEHTSELQSRPHLVCRLLLEKKKKT